MSISVQQHRTWGWSERRVEPLYVGQTVNTLWTGGLVQEAFGLANQRTEKGVWTPHGSSGYKDRSAKSEFSLSCPKEPREPVPLTFTVSIKSSKHAICPGLHSSLWPTYSTALIYNDVSVANAISAVRMVGLYFWHIRENFDMVYWRLLQKGKGVLFFFLAVLVVHNSLIWFLTTLRLSSFFHTLFKGCLGTSLYPLVISLSFSNKPSAKCAVLLANVIVFKLRY